ncbi:CAAX amino terminal protease family [Pyrobaculum oguniense TE7]|uniref:CAAX amino terminal protease family n=1 Tax=Pyrobaculum oguniense (strain DSM 13380 / JCM 10595 / TE7) TaxID=698757 RepID=H6QBK6_PYROT|nr:CAAX amino terminal protease family [Pyrobaculum oguniense TE7]
MIPRLAYVAIFVAAVVLFTLFRPPPCIALYGGVALYAAFLPVGRAVQWRLGKSFPLAFAVYFLALMAGGAVTVAIPQIRESVELLRERQDQFFAVAQTCPLGSFAVAMQAVFLAPLVEEVIFRGILFEEVRRRWGLAPAYVASSLVFALLHRLGLAAVPIFIVALALAFAYHKWGLPASIMLHATQNTLALFIRSL